MGVDGEAVANQAGLFSDVGEMRLVATTGLFWQQDGAVIVSGGGRGFMAL